jgi:hypothetical protein
MCVCVCVCVLNSVQVYLTVLLEILEPQIEGCGEARVAFLGSSHHQWGLQRYFGFAGLKA